MWTLVSLTIIFADCLAVVLSKNHEIVLLPSFPLHGNTFLMYAVSVDSSGKQDGGAGKRDGVGGKQGGGKEGEEKEAVSDNECGEQPAATCGRRGGGDVAKGEGEEESDAEDNPIRQDGEEGSDDDVMIRKVPSSSLCGVKKHSGNQPVVNIPYVPQHRLDTTDTYIHCILVFTPMNEV